jgi:hypothetical protein
MRGARPRKGAARRSAPRGQQQYEAELGDLDAGVEGEERQRQRVLRQPDLAQRAREAEAVEEAEARREQPGPARQRPAPPGGELERQHHEARRDADLHRAAGGEEWRGRRGQRRAVPEVKAVTVPTRRAPPASRAGRPRTAGDRGRRRGGAPSLP